jgi:hypothetical protein
VSPARSRFERTGAEIFVNDNQKTDFSANASGSKLQQATHHSLCNIPIK